LVNRGGIYNDTVGATHPTTTTHPTVP